MGFALLFLLALVPASALAQAESSGGGMPQFQFSNFLTTSQIIWMAVIFLILYLVLWLWVLPSLKAVLDERAERIGRDLDRAKAAKEETDKAVLELTAATRQARAKAEADIAAATMAARDAASRQAAALNARLESQLREAEGQIAAARNQAMRALGEVAATTAAAIVTRLTGRAPEAGALSHAIEVALAAAPHA